MDLLPGLDWLASAAEEPARQRVVWSLAADTRAWLRAGVLFEVVELPFVAGLAAFSRMRASGVRVEGPVTIVVEDVPRPRLQFLVRPGSTTPTDQLLPHDFHGERVDLDFRLTGDWFHVPSIGVRDQWLDRWLRPPQQNPQPLPDAAEVLAAARDSTGLRAASRLRLLATRRGSGSGS